jgi:AAA15 family ATPase/GTPase
MEQILNTPQGNTNHRLKNLKPLLECKELDENYRNTTEFQNINKKISNLLDKDFEIPLHINQANVSTRNFIFTDNEMLVDIGMSKRIPVNMMGDGARKIVSLLTAIYDCKDGALLVDEISNGFHHSVMTDLWKVIINAAIRNNTQLFVTTHDLDSIKGLRNATLEDFKDYVSAFKLLKTQDGELKSFHYSLESLDYSINQEIEVR